jgi:hypothetical protein
MVAIVTSLLLQRVGVHTRGVLREQSMCATQAYEELPSIMTIEIDMV